MYGAIFQEVWTQLQTSLVDTLVAFITSLFGSILPGA